ncbi:ComF family protein [Calidithermus roseus]|uniref:Orotate phosphoribosyltransferase n=1 Tax=Calidithermus roseus TaxID=1644118 RepID=A0A399F5H9_9DEIN|nr:phosphoribosyltransferase family protein [Calidithermus roseus]RIH89871.1 Orotate phosphoribosyltransferase [Calidithermus roseus]
MSAFLETLLGVRCPGCGGKLDLAGLCRACREELRPRHGSNLVYLGHYQRWGRVVRALKYGGKRDLLEALIPPLTVGVQQSWWSLHGVTAVPTLPYRKLVRGYNQAELLGRALARALELPYQETLTRQRYTPSQTRRRLSERAELPEDTFRPRGPLQGRWLLVDDVITSGSTYRRARAALLEAGAQKVYGACISVRNPNVLRDISL